MPERASPLEDEIDRAALVARPNAEPSEVVSDSEAAIGAPRAPPMLAARLVEAASMAESAAATESRGVKAIELEEEADGLDVGRLGVRVSE